MVQLHLGLRIYILQVFSFCVFKLQIQCAIRTLKHEFGYQAVGAS